MSDLVKPGETTEWLRAYGMVPLDFSKATAHELQSIFHAVVLWAAMRCDDEGALLALKKCMRETIDSLELGS